MGAMLPFAKVRLEANGLSYVGLALIDLGVTDSMASQTVVEHLHLTGPSHLSTITTVNGAGDPFQCMKVNFKVFFLDGRRSFNLRNVSTVQSLNINIPPTVNLDKLRKRWPHLKDVELLEHEPQEVCLVIGVDNPAVFVFTDYRIERACNRAPVAFRSPFGWDVVGPESKAAEQPSKCYRSAITSVKDDNFQELVTKFIRAEDFAAKPDAKPHVTKDVARAIDILDRTLRHNGERYVAPLLHRDEKPSLANNYEAAKRRFYKLEARLLKPENAKLHDLYVAGMDAYVKSGHASKLTVEEAAIQPTGRTIYLPHHPVEKPNKPGKYRIVFDAAFRHLLKCLNDILLQRPDWKASLHGLLLRFRLYMCAIVADREDVLARRREGSRSSPLASSWLQ
jgi:hypothetical protein